MILLMPSPMLTRCQLLRGAAAGVATGVATSRPAATSPPVRRNRPGPYAGGVAPARRPLPVRRRQQEQAAEVNRLVLEFLRAL